MSTSPLYVRATALALAAVGAMSCSSPHKDTPETGPAISVTIAQVTNVDWPMRFEAGGTVSARNTALLSSRIVAPIATVAVRGGDVVKRGQVLVTLETAELAAHAASATAAVDAACQAVDAAAADLKSANAALDLARAAHRRIAALHAQRSATPQELDEATAALGIAEARAAGAQARVRESASALEAARAAARAADVATTYGTITAPFDGVVAERAADPGTMAAPGRTLLVIEDPGALALEVRLDASRAANVHLQDVVPAQVGADTAPWTDGRVTEIARVDPAAHSFLVKVSVPSGPSARSGLFGRARFRGADRRALTVPANALIRRGQLTFVFVAGQDNVARLRAVSIGASDADRVEMLDGAAAGERVVLSPPVALRDGSRITATAPPGSPTAPEARR